MLFPFTRFERRDEKITNYMNAKTQRQWEGTDKPGTVFQVLSLLFHIYIICIYGHLLQAKISGSQSYSRCAQSRIMFPLRLFKSYRQMFQPETEGLSKIYNRRYVPIIWRVKRCWKTHAVRMEHHLKEKFIMCLLWAKIRLPLKFLVLTLLWNLIQIHRFASFYLPSGRIDLRKKLKYANKLNCSKF